jgi:hypothetical protein
MRWSNTEWWERNYWGGYPSVTLSNTNPTWTDMVVTLVIRDEKPATEGYPICKSAQTHSGKQKVTWKMVTGFVSWRHTEWRPKGSVSIDQTAGQKSVELWATKYFLIHSTQIGYRGNPVSYYTVVWGSYRRLDWLERELSIHRHLFPILRWRDTLNTILQMFLW